MFPLQPLSVVSLVQDEGDIGIQLQNQAEFIQLNPGPKHDDHGRLEIVIFGKTIQRHD